MGKFIDLSDQRFGRLTVTKEHYTDKKSVWWVCVCDCGGIARVKAWYLRSGDTKSCGCLKSEQARITNTTHGESKSKLYGAWNTMKYRCQNPNSEDYHNYGGRGITVCQEWQQYKSFAAWSREHGYKEGLSIDRIDVNKGYSPDNCRWADSFVQANNKRDNRWIEAGGERLTVSQWARKIGRADSNLRRSLKINPRYLEDRIT